MEDLTEILQDNLPEGQAKDHLQKLARDCARNETSAVDKVNEILGSIDVNMDDVLRDARVNQGEELVKEYARRETRGVSADSIIFWRKPGRQIDGLLVWHFEESG